MQDSAEAECRPNMSGLYSAEAEPLRSGFLAYHCKRVRFVALIATRFAVVFFTLCKKSPNCMFRHDSTDVRIQTNNDKQLLNAVLVPYVAILAGYAGS